MDFSEILRIASENQGCKDRELPEKKGINTSLGKPKRKVQDKKDKGVKSAAVQAFLKKQEEDERKKAEEALKKKEHLMKLREEKNTVGKLRNIIKRNHTKEAIFEVEGSEKKGDKQTTPESPHVDQQVNGKIEYTKLKSQYGGKERRALFQNVVRKKVSAHWEPKVEATEDTTKTDGSESAMKKDLDGKKVHNSKSVSSKEHTKGHTNHSTDNSKHTEDRHNKDKKLKEAEVKKKKKPQGPPPMSFDDILKLAQQKKGEPDKTDVKKTGNKKEPEKSKKPDRPMTKEEKERWERVNSKEYQDWIKYGKQRPEFCVNAKKKKNKTNSPGSKSGVSAISNEFVAGSDVESSDEDNTREKAEPIEKGIKQSQGQNRNSSVQRGHNGACGISKGASAKADVKSRPSSALKEGNSKLSSGNPKALKLRGGPDLVETQNNSKCSSSANVNKKQPTVPKSASSIKQSSSSQGTAKSSKYNEVHENVLVCGSGGQKAGREKNIPQMSAWDQVYGQYQKKKTEKKRRVIESEDEDLDGDLEGFVVDEDDDDDMDDFIDDSEAVDYSKHIRDIFGYDKKKYQYIDEEDSDDMEAGFMEIEKEEETSAKIGMQEDLLDMKMEEEHKKRKMAMKKMAAKKKKYR